MTDTGESSLREQWNRWNSTHTTSSSGVNEGAKTFFSGWAETLNNTANDVYNRLPLTQQDADSVAQQEPEWFTLSRFERLMGFIACLLGSAVCFTISFLLFPVLALKPRKFGLLWSLGSLLFVISFGLLQGPVAYFKHLTSSSRLPFTVLFFSSVILTIYFAAVVKSTILTLISSVFEVVAIIYYTVSYFPFGAQGLRMATAVGARQIGSFAGF
ncbi:SFT2 [Cyberlindnera jadinii]|uniref:Protein transport protein SFT2 n=1 Tax=Cyberlindnera jadinii (strain ATCC 18201 / CBS 1600 / BCRC 20928 / JCM 3617 / NBRC 0987 / NRRL Y-1542) TaxID=983966 RepID=A0A0H5C3I2_CYBJN|nr:SFT2-domain-containing protein [Cyberlindnera jadinii NRRL Y-1542]ODV75307.1 SFT2-domain-containing protein [Cyberlindnera jadinii NRRL Y-1542]CEP22453.1 SFT2 [Cyberlindnera jadinii]